MIYWLLLANAKCGLLSNIAIGGYFFLHRWYSLVDLKLVYDLVLLGFLLFLTQYYVLRVWGVMFVFNILILRVSFRITY